MTSNLIQPWMIEWYPALVVLGFLATLVSWRVLLRFGPRDEPGQRRIHTTPTPRGGAIGIAAIIWMASAIATLLYSIAALAPPLLLLSSFALLGALDDFKPQGAGLRLVVQFGIAGFACQHFLPDASVALQALAIFACVTLVNFANFLDGSNGYLAGLFVLFGVFALALKLPGAELVCSIAALYIGFLPFNFPNARVFMGDVGSYLIGATLAYAMFATLGHSVTPDGELRDTHALLQLGMLLLPFCIDPLLTILCRACKRRAIWRAHREHAFQWLRRSGFSASALLLASGAEAFVLALLAARASTDVLTWLLPAWITFGALAWFWLKRTLLRWKRLGTTP